ncbi:MAG: AGE family epimerase/isomerase [Limisphaerales bacterium]
MIGGRFNLLLACALLLGGAGTAWAATAPGAGGPDAGELRRQADRCRNLLRRTVFDFYMPGCLDRIHGGYLEDWRDGKFVFRGEKFLTLQARQLWFFSTMASENIERAECLNAAWLGYEFLQRAFRDARNGGYFSKATDAGEPVDRRKHAYHNSFMIYALVAYHQATRDGSALKQARELFQVWDRRAHDARNGGYAEFFYGDWRPVTDPAESRYVGAIGTKTYNTHLHLLESFTALGKVWPDATLRNRVEELVRINAGTVQHPGHRFNLDGWLPNWTVAEVPGNQRASYGHDVECIWLTLDAVRTLGRSEHLYRGWAESLADYSLTNGYDAVHGGFFYTGAPGESADETKKEWWVQSEALVGMLDLYRLTGNVRYYRAFAETLDFIERHQVAPDGGWWATRAADGSAHPNRSRSSMWQGAYHNGRALLLSAKMLSNLKPTTH